ncbi:hypothetical protein AYI68_g4863 [Smittium mucronatum]|uniref:Reverse transcriptase domain-containing protein n=1 Tax=Smittium mucronatum TaxID=133383 RepID=A0A1R0GVZ0_9FUNG|nr:hypothetical protein AYI68_g4863 [Smittium mucronatum]
MAPIRKLRSIGICGFPVMLYFYINDILKDAIGVEVPGIVQKIPGLFFADDAVLLADSEKNSQKSLDVIIACSYF